MEFYYYSPSETFVVLTADQFFEIRCIGKVLLVLGSRLKNEYTFTFPSVYPWCLFSLIAFEIRCIGRILLVRGSRLKNEENMRVSLCFSSMIIFTDGS